MDTTTLHPMIVHFPIALLLTGLLFTAISMFCNKCCCKKSAANCSTDSPHPSCVARMGFWLLVTGTLGSIASVVSGFLFTTMGEAAPFFTSHHTFAISTMAVAIVTTAIYAFYIYKAPKNTAVKWIAFLLYIAVAAMIALTGHYGGLLR